MKVILTEKPSVARDIAKCLAINSKRDGYFEGNAYQITWAFGHLVELKEPDEYHPEWKRWSLDALPIIPEQFGLKARGDESAQKQLNTIRRLFQSADEIICATDAGREGELIFRYILSWTQCLQKPFKRLWISSLTDDAIRRGFAQLQDGNAYDGLYRAAKCRSESDWIVGLNSTRLYTLKFGQQGTLWTLGRVQTPVLAMIVQKDLEITRFVPKDFWELHTLYRGADFQYAGGRFDRKPDAEALLSRIEGHDFGITSVKGKRELVNPPLLYDLTDLQKDMSIRYGFTAEQTLTCAQQLYEKKHITYPRTDSRCLTNDMKPGMKPLLEKLRMNFGQQIAALDLDKLAFSSRCFNDAKVTDHHAIIPTAALPGSLANDEANVYEAIVLRFIASFYPSCVKQITTVLGETRQVKFKTTGTIIESPGWQVLYKNDSPGQQGSEIKILPHFAEGETGPHQPSINQGKTTPPKAYNEASLLGMMESAGKTCDDEELKEALKEKGLGTPATRASIIEVLIKRNYIQRQKKLLLSTGSGRHLISIIADDRLKSAAMTGEWEAKLKKIEHNEYDPDQFMAEIIQFTRQLKDESAKPLYDDSRLGDCPLCQHPIIEGRQGYGCSQWKAGCKFVLWKKAYDVNVTRDMACQLLQNGRTLNAYAIKINDDVLNAQLTLNPMGDIGYNKLQNQQAANLTDTLADCPLCNGKIIETGKAYSCSEWRNGCKVVIWKTIAQKKITPAIAKRLLNKGETGILKGFKSAKGTAFEVNLKLVNGKVEMDFAGR
ncbi:MAG: DNA topoisomerase 3 [Methylococcales bacterium]|nr:DNA topoisomerase 3 [Methylococcales bacterium]MDD5633379.1 DNA topoisomerase 3 [Methylococcales bacterium]